jgi:hypothetical protein
MIYHLYDRVLVQIDSHFIQIISLISFMLYLHCFTFYVSEAIYLYI